MVPGSEHWKCVSMFFRVSSLTGAKQADKQHWSWIKIPNIFSMYWLASSTLKDHGVQATVLFFLGEPFLKLNHGVDVNIFQCTLWHPVHWNFFGNPNIKSMLSMSICDVVSILLVDQTWLGLWPTLWPCSVPFSRRLRTRLWWKRTRRIRKVNLPLLLRSGFAPFMRSSWAGYPQVTKDWWRRFWGPIESFKFITWFWYCYIMDRYL